MQKPPYSLPADIKIIFVPRPVDNERLSLDGFQIDKAPKPAVIAFIPVIPHDKQAVRRHGHRSETVPWLHTSGNDIGIFVDNKRAALKRPIDKDLLISTFHHIAGDTDNALDKIFAGIFRIFKHHYIPPFGIADRNQCRIEIRKFNAIDELVDQNMIPDLKRFFHGTGGYLKRLNDECTNEKRQNNGDNDGFDIFPKATFARGDSIF